MDKNQKPTSLQANYRALVRALGYTLSDDPRKVRAAARRLSTTAAAIYDLPGAESAKTKYHENLAEVTGTTEKDMARLAKARRAAAKLKEQTADAIIAGAEYLTKFAESLRGKAK